CSRLGAGWGIRSLDVW
nr:immunoglobulin heavy chain junction region [Macaca mulatta]MOW81365.1 immunoglobulin heavy chain junction region [Macaca mulatta]MOW84048.1 immunoglobulin heavy chain junction region [Macaca mulatta]MOW84866.1 immunoglobulin heavy chain junction region [Macaca mulatta]MOW86050.1 immunoglobulin heavy chain junction region [Macaca mulatta]